MKRIMLLAFSMIMWLVSPAMRVNAGEQEEAVVSYNGNRVSVSGATSFVFDESGDIYKIGSENDSYPVFFIYDMPGECVPSGNTQNIECVVNYFVFGTSMFNENSLPVQLQITYDNIPVSKDNGATYPGTVYLTFSKMLSGNNPGSSAEQNSPNRNNSENANLSDSKMPKYEHKHNWEWVKIEDASEVLDGKEVLYCVDCDTMGSSRAINNSAYAKFCKNSSEKIRNAEENSIVEIKTDIWCSVTKEVINAIKERRDVTVNMILTNQNKKYRLSIPAECDMSVLEDADYYGVLYLNQFFEVVQ